jgi:sarcosine oxidase/L-pipecolate oxidase
LYWHSNQRRNDSVSDQYYSLTGAGTARLLADNAPHRQEIQAEHRITAAAVVTGIIKLNIEQMRIFKDIPSFIHSIGEVQGMTRLTIRMNTH